VTTERQVLQQLRALNPITDERTIDLPETSSTAFLEALETRRKIMSVTTEQPVEKSPKERTRRRNIALALGAAVIVAAIGVSALLVTDDGSDVASPRAVVEEFIDLQSSGQIVASLELATDEMADRERDSYEGFEVWNSRSEQTEPCQEISQSRFRCVTLDYDDFHGAGGLNPFENHTTFTVNEAGVISDVTTSLVDFPAISGFNLRFMSWLTEAHPEQAAQMSLPPSDNFNAEAARIALQYVDEFVAQSDDYPINP